MKSISLQLIVDSRPATFASQSRLRDAGERCHPGVAMRFLSGCGKTPENAIEILGPQLFLFIRAEPARWTI